MPTQQKANKEYKCSLCGKIINKGEQYIKHSMNFGPTKVRCIDHPFKRADLTSSEYLQTIYSLQDDTSFEATCSEDLEQLRDDMINEIESLKDETESRLYNMPDSLQESPTGELLQERISSMEDALSDLESLEIPDREDYETDDEYEEACQEAANEIDYTVNNLE